MTALEKVKTITFGVAFGICAIVWIFIIAAGLIGIGDLGIGGFIALVLFTTFVLAIPLAILSLVLGLHKIKKVQKIDSEEVSVRKVHSNHSPQKQSDINSEYEKFKSETSVTKQIVEETVKVPVPSQTVQPREVQESKKPSFKKFDFRVAGVTMKNDSGKDIQRLLKRFGKLHCEEYEIELYEGWSNKDIIEYDVEVYEFGDLQFETNEIKFVDEPTNEYDPNAKKVLIDFDGAFIHVGYVPRKEVAELNDILKNKEVRSITAQYVGGKKKCVEYDAEKDKDIVVIEDLTLGVEIEIKYV